MSHEDSHEFLGLIEMAKGKHSINLLHGEGPTFFQTFMHWALAVGRLLVILTEIVALSAFLYRFSIDRQLIDLHDEIKSKQQIVAAFKTQEDIYRDVQARLALAKTLDTKSTAATKLIADIINQANNRAVFQSLTITPTNISIEGSSPSISRLTVFVNSLREHPDIASVSLDKIENKPTAATIVFNITATLKTEL